MSRARGCSSYSWAFCGRALGIAALSRHGLMKRQRTAMPHTSSRGRRFLCECETSQEAWQVGETLRRAGIQSWVTGLEMRDGMPAVPGVQVAADQLEQAQAVLASPIPQEVIEESQKEDAGIRAPRVSDAARGQRSIAGKRGSGENTWLCETCGAEWSDPEDGGADDGESSLQRPDDPVIVPGVERSTDHRLVPPRACGRWPMHRRSSLRGTL